ncbi:TaqI-like C-terminal specificity domain-containing protein, partial [Curvivirga sp.]|uniref:TaqI-like C-terminal specificity domain-containing protein n=1 Tax=Curvivirga sp. TaxID=2856848 RepID=UPI003B5B22C8
DHANSHYNRGESLLCLKRWEEAKTDLITAQKMGLDIVATFRNDYRNVAAFEQKHQVKLPKDIIALVRQGFRHRYPMQEKALGFEGKPLESPEVLDLLQRFRDAGPPLGEYLKVSPSFGIETVPTDVFVVDGKIRDKLIAEHVASADILKPFLQGPDIRRWHVEPQDQWLIFTYRGVEINAYPAILKYLEKYKELLSKRGNEQEWYELQASLEEVEHFAQPKLICPNLYNTQTFALETEGLYCGYTCYVIPTDEKWLCGLLNTLPVEWFYSQVSKQLDGGKLEARSEYIKQIPVPDINETQKDLVRKLVDYLIYLQKQPTTNSKDLAYARDFIVLRYFEWIINGLVYEFYMPDVLQSADRDIFKHLMEEQLPEVDEMHGDKMSIFRSLYERLHDREHPVRVNTFFQDGLRPIRIIEDKW